MSDKINFNEWKFYHFKGYEPIIAVHLDNDFSFEIKLHRFIEFILKTDAPLKSYHDKLGKTDEDFLKDIYDLDVDLDGWVDKYINDGTNIVQATIPTEYYPLLIKHYKNTLSLPEALFLNNILETFISPFKDAGREDAPPPPEF